MQNYVEINFSIGHFNILMCVNFLYVSEYLNGLDTFAQLFCLLIRWRKRTSNRHLITT